MARGRRPLPSAVKDLRGNPGHRPVNQAEPVAGDGDPLRPEGLSEAANREWDEILPILKTMRVVGPADGKALAMYCHAFHRWQQAEENIERLGIVLEEMYLPDVVDPRFRDLQGLPILGKKYKKNPAVGISFEAMKTMKSYLIEFGMTPASRGKLHVEKPKEVDPMDAWLKQKMERNSAATKAN